jgi:uncharacterized membrane protein
MRASPDAWVEASGGHALATSSAVSGRPRTRYVLLTALGLMTLFVVYKDELFIFDHKAPEWAYFFPVRWPLLFHGLGGLLALLAGPIQFSTRVRQRYLQFHRIVGRCYVGGVAVAAPVSIYLFFVHFTNAERVEGVFQASWWVITTGVALICARSHNIAQHRQWVVRSYAVTCFFVTSRVAFAVPPISHMEVSNENIALFLWPMLAVTIVGTELGLQWRAIFHHKRP